MAIRLREKQNRRKMKEALLPPFDPSLIRDVYRSESSRKGKGMTKAVVVVR